MLEGEFLSLELEDKTILVTGAGRGIGRATALEAVTSGAKVIAVARTQGDLDDLHAQHPKQIETWATDVTKRDFYSRVESLQQLDGVFNNAGINIPQDLLEVTEEALDSMLTLNIKSMFLTAQSAARVMSKQQSGVIVNMSSQLGHVGCRGRSVYCATKHAIEGMTKAMAVEMAPLGLRINSVAPTFIETPLTKPMFEDPEFQSSVVSRIPMGRIGQSKEIASAVVFMLSESSSLMTGTSLVLDGGWTAQ